MRRGSRRAMAERRQERENVHSPPNRMSGIGVTATVQVERDVCLTSTRGHASEYRLPGQWVIPFVNWKSQPKAAQRSGPSTRTH